jgi:hypothetical protein
MKRPSGPKKRPPRSPQAGAASPVVPTRGIRGGARLVLFVRAGGRCEFDGCNRYLMEHHLTLADGNFGEMAHIVAFRTDGPRGQGPRPAAINSVDNLMLLCPHCHKLIDDNPGDYSRQALKEYKASHEGRIRHVTDLGPNRKTAVLVLQALIGGQTVAVPFDQIVEATAPRYPMTRKPLTIDLTGIPSSDGAFVRTACDAISKRVADFFRPEGEGATAGHVSVFALGPIPLLVCLGRQMTNKVASDVYQRHRDTETWTWKTRGKPATYAVRRVRRGTDRRKVALILSLSGKIRLRDLPNDVRDSSTVYEMTLKDQTPQPTFLRYREELETFRIAYQELLGRIVEDHGLVRSIDCFPAVPAPIAVLCGRELLPKVHPALRVFDYDKTHGGFTFQLEV